MKNNYFKKKVLSTALAWMLIAGNLFPSMSVQAASLTEDVVVEQAPVTEQITEQEEITDVVAGIDEDINLPDDNINDDNNTTDDDTGNDVQESGYEIYPSPYTIL